MHNIDVKIDKGTLSFIGFVLCSIASTYLLIEMIISWKSELGDIKIPSIWIIVTLLYYNNWKTNGKRKNSGVS
ncbi:MAG: hypothetical protein DI529_15365 [Chryseobacterium sp.]|nr:MAG: hypothetical protein DI529_15365 [Chryseobacterium sp.]